jgi:hypothetical protein
MGTLAEAVKKMDPLSTYRVPTLKVLTPGELGQLEFPRIADVPHGFQRDLNQDMVAQIKVSLQGGAVPLLPIVLATVKGRDRISKLYKGKLIIVDGQHRAQAAIEADTTLPVVIYEFGSYAEVVSWFLVLNMKQRKLNPEVALASSRNPVALETKRLASKLGVRRNHVQRLIASLRFGKTTRYFDLVDLDSYIPERYIKAAEEVLARWKRGKQWPQSVWFPPESTGSATRSVGKRIVSHGHECNTVVTVPCVMTALGNALRTFDLIDKPRIAARLAALIQSKINWEAQILVDSIPSQGMFDVCVLSDLMIDICVEEGWTIDPNVNVRAKSQESAARREEFHQSARA